VVLTVVNMVFLVLGVLLTLYAAQNGIDAVRDQLFPTIAVDSGLGIGLAIVFLLGLIAAAYSSADSALTSLTTSFSIDILDIEKKYDEAKQILIRKRIHVAMSIVLILVIIVFKYIIADETVISKLFTFAGYTYGPLLGLYAFGLFTRWKIKDNLVPFIAIASPFLAFLTSYVLETYAGILVGFTILLINGGITFLGLVLIRREEH